MHYDNLVLSIDSTFIFSDDTTLEKFNEGNMTQLRNKQNSGVHLMYCFFKTTPKFFATE